MTHSNVTSNRLLFSFLFVFFLLVVNPVFSAGLWLYEVASPELGTASAGAAAIANSASTAGFNPAGMTRLKQSELMAGFQPMHVEARFDIDSATHGNDDGGNAGGFVPVASLFYVNNYSDELKFGLATGSYLGLGLDYGESWAGRYMITEGELVTFTVNPSVAYKVNQQFSIGGGINLVYSKLDQKIAFPNPLSNDGSIEIKDSDIAYGFNLGLLYEFSENTRLGLTYRSQVDIEFEDAVSLKGLLPGIPNVPGLANLRQNTDTDIDMYLPQSILFSAYHKLNHSWSLMGNLGWQDWSEFGNTDFTLNNLNRSIKDERDFDDIWHVALGTHYQWSDSWILMAGIAYDSSPVSDNKRTIDMPLDRQIRYALGAQYEYSKDLSIMFGYEFMDAGRGKVNQTENIAGTTSTLKGDFESNYLHILTLNAQWKF
ncbi:MAG: hypothetical protein GY694_18185 [Gammaproteobacteria bacterium]|nr:hypothetical protein [Gammaproteobacteria bacterium]